MKHTTHVGRAVQMAYYAKVTGIVRPEVQANTPEGILTRSFLKLSFQALRKL